jgi:hypothetical protein
MIRLSSFTPTRFGIRPEKFSFHKAPLLDKDNNRHDLITSPAITDILWNHQTSYMSSKMVSRLSFSTIQETIYRRHILTSEQSLSLLELPTEVLVQICKVTEAQDLPILRQVCKRLSDVATPRFAMVNFTETVHVVSPYSIDTLVNITEHAVFGDYVQAVAICSARRTNMSGTIKPVNTNNQSLCLNAYIKTRRFARRMERIFNNIKSRHGSVTISIYDNPGREGFGVNPIIKFTPSMVMRCYGWTQLSGSDPTSITYRTAETLEETIYAARRARCPIKRLKINLFAYTKFNQAMHMELDGTMRRVLESSLTPLSIDLGGRNTSQMSYDHELQCLKFGSGGHDYGGVTLWLGSRASYTWLLTQRVKQLSIIDDNLRLSTVQPFFSSHLRRLKIEKVTVYTGSFDQNLWSELLETVSALSGLQYCGLGDLTYCIRLTWDDTDDGDVDYQKCLVLPGHEDSPYPCESPFFKLLFPSGVATVELDGDDVFGKLQDLASYVRAAENRKFRRIVRDGSVRDSIVGVIEE